MNRRQKMGSGDEQRPRTKDDRPVTDAAMILLSLGGILLAGLATDAIGRHTPLPRVTLLLIFGVLIGPEYFDLLPETLVGGFDIVAMMALVMVGFLLGGQFTLSALREHGREILWISVAAVIVPAALVFAALTAVGIETPLALILAGIAPATAPAATVDVVREAKARGPFARALLGIVALDDAWGLLLFSLCLSSAAAMLGAEGSDSAVRAAAWEIGGALFLGVLLGLPTAYLTGRISPGEPTLTEALGVVFLCGGLAIWMDVSFLIAAMVLGMVVINLAKHHTRPFHAIENVEWPIIMLFFVLAGASLELTALSSIGLVAAAYILARAVGKVLGGWTGGLISRAETSLRRWIGLALLPQAGVALGMSLVASSRLPQFTETLLAVIIGSTILFDLAGPVLTRFILHRAGEASRRRIDSG